MVIIEIHNYIRWLILIILVLIIGRHLIGMLKNRPFLKLDYSLSLILTISIDVMLLIGILVYFTSPLGYEAFKTWSGEVMKLKMVRFRAVEHPLIMLVAIILIHIGAAQRKKNIEDKIKHKKMFLYYFVSLILILIGIPWSK